MNIVLSNYVLNRNKKHLQQNFNRFIIVKIFTIVFIFYFFPINLNSQHDTIKVPLNSGIPMIITPNTYEFEIEMNNLQKIRLNADNIKSYSFNKPGIYKIYPKLIHNHINGHDCSVIQLPDTIIISTDNYKMEFIDSTFKLHKPIIKNNPIIDNYLEIKVNVTDIYENTPIFLINKKLKTSGIGTNIYGELAPNYEKLKKGINILRYNLHGACTMNSYIQFDFMNNVGNIYSISLNSPIKDF